MNTCTASICTSGRLCKALSWLQPLDLHSAHPGHLLLCLAPFPSLHHFIFHLPLALSWWILLQEAALNFSADPWL